MNSLSDVANISLFAALHVGLMPTVLLGTAVGAAVVYGIDEGDPLAAQKKLVPKVQKSIKSAHREIQVAAGEVSRLGYGKDHMSGQPGSSTMGTLVL